MSEIIIPVKEKIVLFKKDEKLRTSASKKYKKDCYDFICLEDGTVLGEHKYCQLSMECQHKDYDENGKSIPMKTHILPVINTRTGEVVEHQMTCTGIVDRRSLNERRDDDTVS